MRFEQLYIIVSFPSRCIIRLGELENVEGVWLEYKETRRELEFLLTQERDLLERLTYSQEIDSEGNRLGAEANLKVGSLLYLL